jgi:hypothetical protein
MVVLNFRLSKRCFAEANLFSSLGTCFLVGLLVVLVVSCQPDEQRPTTAAVSGTISLPVGEKILSKNRRFVYAVRWYAPGATTAQLDTVTMTATGTPWSIDTTQTRIVWLFPADTLWAKGSTQGVGAIENKEEFWLHPPRYGRYRILELNPFPYIKLPAVSGRTWEWMVYPPEMYADPAWASWKGILQVNFRYTLGDIVQLTSPLGKLSCSHVQATGASKLGATALEAYFHPAYGFVRLHYRNIDASRMQLELVAVDVQPESSERALQRALNLFKLDSGVSRAAGRD